ncbi:hypothetical protein DNTS_035469 [Danionella cerebrum]|nr:hypothetical protein DNTS_035469 [Danionella translucida]
MKKWTVS